jgi:hypothetical protein
MQDRSQRLQRELPVRQETILLEAAQRVRRYAGLGEKAKHSRPLIIVVTKYDSWSPLLDGLKLSPPWTSSITGELCAMQLEWIEEVSKKLRAVLWKLCPEIVSAAEGFAEQVIYMPVSATGRSPEIDPATGAFGIRPRDMNPMWAETPLLYALSRWTEGLISYRRPSVPMAFPLPTGNVPAGNVSAGNVSATNGTPPAGFNVMPPTAVRNNGPQTKNTAAEGPTR